MWNPKPLTGRPAIDAYNREGGALLDAHLRGEIDRDDTRMWAMELKAQDVLNYLDGGRLIIIDRVVRCLMPEEFKSALAVKRFWESASQLDH